MSITAAAELALVLQSLGVAAQTRGSWPGVVVGDERHVQVFERPFPTVATVERLLHRHRPIHPPVVVCERIGQAQRRLLREGDWGWLDRRGHLVVPSLALDERFDSLQAPDLAEPDPWRGKSVISVAVCLLQRHGPAPATRDLGPYAGISAAGACRALQILRDEGFVDEGGVSRRETLFGQVASRWRPRWHGLAAVPCPEHLDAEHQRVLNIGRDRLDRPGWANLGHSAHAAYEVPSPDDVDPRPRLLLPDRRALSWALRLWGVCENDEAAALIALGRPIPTCSLRQPPPETGIWPLAHPVAVALDLATRGEGTHGLQNWNPRWSVNVGGP